SSAVCGGDVCVVSVVIRFYSFLSPGGDRHRDVGRADVLATGKGGQSLDVYTEQIGERAGLRLADLWEVGSDLLHGAVPLTQLDGHPAQRSGAGGEPVLAERFGQHRGTLVQVASGSLHAFAVAVLQVTGTLFGECGQRLGPHLL